MIAAIAGHTSSLRLWHRGEKGWWSTGVDEASDLDG